MNIELALVLIPVLISIITSAFMLGFDRGLRVKHYAPLHPYGVLFWRVLCALGTGLLMGVVMVYGG